MVHGGTCLNPYIQEAKAGGSHLDYMQDALSKGNNVQRLCLEDLVFRYDMITLRNWGMIL
jgi:hypothetical protein